MAMNAIIPALAAAVALQSGGSQLSALPAPIAAASDGRMQCYTPNVVKKTCRSLAGYKTEGDGAIWHQATVMVSPQPLITMQTSTRVMIKKGQVCGAITKEDIDKAKFMVGDKPATPAQAASYRPEIVDAYRGTFGHEICTAYLADGAGLVARGSIDGAVQEGVDQKVIWVTPAEGYKVRP
jgi:hypothetical protein